MAGFFVQPKAKHRHKGMLWGMYVRPRHRDKRIGRQLVEAIIEVARRRGRGARLGGGVEPAVSEGPGVLVAEFGALREQPPSRERTRRLGEVIAGPAHRTRIPVAAR